jgi:uncharacterized OsmC-like protein
MVDDIQTVRLTQVQDYQFNVDFGARGPARCADEPSPPDQNGVGPSSVQLLAAALGNCLSASLLLGLRKFRQAPEPLTCTVQADVDRNAEGGLRALKLTARLTLGAPATTIEHVDRVMSGFESYCTMTQSVSPDTPVVVEVFDAAGTRLK